MNKVFVIVEYQDYHVEGDTFVKDNCTVSIFEKRLCAIGVTEKAARKAFFPQLGGGSDDLPTVEYDKRVLYGFEGATAQLVKLMWHGNAEYYLIREATVHEESDDDKDVHWPEYVVNSAGGKQDDR